MHIHLTIPDDFSLPDGWNTLTPIENFYLLSLGFHVIQTCKTNICNDSTLSSAQIKLRCENDIRTIKDTMLEQFTQERLCMQQSWQQEKAALQEKYDSLQSFVLKSALLQQELDTLKTNMQNMIDQSVLQLTSSNQHRVIEEQKESIRTLMHKVEELQAMAIVNKSTAQGKDGESFFFDMATSAFYEYIPGFSLFDISKTGHSGDFHLSSKQMTVMVDCKNYKLGNVPTSQLEKLKQDMQNYPHIRIGWLVCLNKPFSNKHLHLPFSFEFGEDNTCIFFINSLQFQDNPVPFLRSLWTASELLYKQFLCNDSENNSLAFFKQRNESVKQKLQDIISSKKEFTSVIKRLKDLSSKQDEELQSLILTLSKNFSDEYQKPNWDSLFKEFWNKHFMNHDSKSIKVSELYKIFSFSIKPFIIDFESFKEYILHFFESSRIEYNKTKTNFSVLQCTICKLQK